VFDLQTASCRRQRVAALAAMSCPRAVTFINRSSFSSSSALVFTLVFCSD